MRCFQGAKRGSTEDVTFVHTRALSTDNFYLSDRRACISKLIIWRLSTVIELYPLYVQDTATINVLRRQIRQHTAKLTDLTCVIQSILPCRPQDNAD